MEQALRELNDLVKKRLEDLEKNVTKEEYVESRDNFLRTFNEFLYELESQYPEKKEKFRKEENKLWKKIEEVLERLDAIHKIAPWNLSGRNIKGMLSGQGGTLKKDELQGANLSKSRMKDVNLSGANLRGADLRNTNLAHCLLNGADLTGADLRYAVLDYRTLEEDIHNNFVDTMFRRLMGRNFDEIIIDETTILDPSQIDFLTELNNNDIRIHGLDQYLAHHRPAAAVVAPTAIASGSINIPSTTTTGHSGSPDEEYFTPNSSFSDHSVDDSNEERNL